MHPAIIHKPDVAKKKPAKDKVDHPHAVKLSEADGLALAAYNRKYFQGTLKPGTLLRLLVRMGLTHPPDNTLLETHD